jgi:hypothetical protein
MTKRRPYVTAANPGDVPLPPVYLPRDIAKALHCSEWWVKEQARRGRIPFSKPGGRYRFTAEHFAEGALRPASSAPVTFPPGPWPAGLGDGLGGRVERVEPALEAWVQLSKVVQAATHPDGQYQARSHADLLADPGRDFAHAAEVLGQRDRRGGEAQLVERVGAQRHLRLAFGRPDSEPGNVADRVLDVCT